MTVNSFYQLAQALADGPAVLATVVNVRGSVPREIGARMVIAADGRTFNTIGGGAGEAKVIRQALVVLETGSGQWVEIDLSGAPNREVQGVCGGWMQIWLERWQGDSAIALVHQILQRLEAGQPVALVTPFAEERSPYLDDSAPTHASLGLGEPSLPPPSSRLSSTDFRDWLWPPPTLLIVGAGHVGEQLAKVADLIGFQVVVQDDRPEWANSQRYPQAFRILTEPVECAIAHFANHPQFYAALVTRGFQYDLEALKALLKREVPCQYLGMIGSLKRVRQVFQTLEDAGFPRSRLETIHAPIGLDIGALTPEEIAVSIAAELIMVRRSDRPRQSRNPN